MIKKTIPFLTFLLLTLTTSAQITKGNWMVGGTGNFENNNIETNIKSSNTTSTESGRGLQVQPNVGYFLADKFAIGLNPSLSINFTDDKTLTNYAIGGFTRYYLLNSEKLINILTQVEYLYSPPNNNGSTTENLGFKAGPAIFFNESVALELTLNYNIVNFDSEFSSSKWKTFNISIGFQIHLKK